MKQSPYSEGYDSYLQSVKDGCRSVAVPESLLDDPRSLVGFKEGVFEAACDQYADDYYTPPDDYDYTPPDSDWLMVIDDISEKYEGINSTFRAAKFEFKNQKIDSEYFSDQIIWCRHHFSAGDILTLTPLACDLDGFLHWFLITHLGSHFKRSNLYSSSIECVKSLTYKDNMFGNHLQNNIFVLPFSEYFFEFVESIASRAKEELAEISAMAMTSISDLHAETNMG